MSVNCQTFRLLWVWCNICWCLFGLCSPSGPVERWGQTQLMILASVWFTAFSWLDLFLPCAFCYSLCFSLFISFALFHVSSPIVILPQVLGITILTSCLKYFHLRHINSESVMEYDGFLCFFFSLFFLSHSFFLPFFLYFFHIWNLLIASTIKGTLIQWAQWDKLLWTPILTFLFL